MNQQLQKSLIIICFRLINKILFCQSMKNTIQDNLNNPENDSSLFKSTFLSPSDIRQIASIQYPQSLEIKNKKSAKQHQTDLQSKYLDHLKQTEAVKVCRIKYSDQFNEKKNHTNINAFNSTHIKQSIQIKDNKKRKQQPNFKYKNLDSNQFWSNTDKLSPYLHYGVKNNPKIKFETIYGAIESSFPKKKFFPKLFNHERVHSEKKKPKNNYQTIPIVENKTERLQNQQYLKITNHQFKQNLRHFQQVQRLQMSFQNKKIQQKQRKFRENSSTDFSLYLLPKQNEQRHHNRLVFYPFDRKNKVKPPKKQKPKEKLQKEQRYSPWQKQKTQQSSFGEIL